MCAMGINPTVNVNFRRCRRTAGTGGKKVPLSVTTARKSPSVYVQRGLSSPKKRAQPVHIHLNNVTFVAGVSEPRPPPPRKFTQWVTRMKKNHPWVFWPIYSIFSVVKFLLDRVGFGIRLN